MNIARLAYDAKFLPKKSLIQLEKNLLYFEKTLTEPTAPSLIHGDLWPKNILSQGNSIQGIIDPSICFAHREFELAYLAFYGSLSQDFWQRYQMDFPLDNDFFKIRMPIYQLYVLLIHIQLLKGSRLDQLNQQLSSFHV